MSNDFLKYTIGGILLLFFQVQVCNNIPLLVNGLINPFIYPFLLLILPFTIPRGALLLVGFAMGITVDMFSNTYGMHGAATVFIAWIRPALLNRLTPKSGYETDDTPRIASLGLTWFATYALLILLLHHITYFFLEAFSFSFFSYTMLKILVSLAFSTLLIVLIEYLFTRKK